MKLNRFLLLFLLFSIAFMVNGQVGINTDGSNPDNSAMLDVKSVEKGLLVPRMSESERDAIQNPADGLLIFNSTSGTFNYYVNSTWRIIGGTNCQKPDDPLEILGSDTVCNNSENVVYSIDPCFGADSYEWSVFSSGTITSGQGTTSITVDYSPGSSDGYLSVKAINDCGSSDLLQQTIILLDSTRVNRQPQNAFAINGGDAGFKFDVSGDSVHFHWQESQGTGFYNLTNGGIYSGVLTDTLTLTDVQTVMNGYKYRCIVWSPCSTQVISNEVTLSVDQYQCGIATVTDIDQNVYNTVSIGSQCWLKQNLNTGVMINAQQEPGNNSTIEKYCYDNEPDSCDVYGGLYKWAEMMQYSTIQGSQGICPEGWHIPTQSEFTEMVTYLGGSTVAGSKLKEMGLDHWISPNVATNESGFTALGGGYMSGSSFFSLVRNDAYFWTSTEQTGSNAWYRYLYNDTGQVYTYNWSKTFAYSVRCLRD